jgi:hypothetical protein
MMKRVIARNKEETRMDKYSISRLVLTVLALFAAGCAGIPPGTKVILLLLTFDMTSFIITDAIGL